VRIYTAALPLHTDKRNLLLVADNAADAINEHQLHMSDKGDEFTRSMVPYNA
jgi:hypothetical protein